MNWRSLLQEKDETIVSPWVGGRDLRSGPRKWHIEGNLPTEHCWAKFSLKNRVAHFEDICDSLPELLQHKAVGYLVGDRLLRSDIRSSTDARTIVMASEKIHLIEPGLDRFALISAGRMYENGPLIFIQQEMPLGPEPEVLSVYLDNINGHDTTLDEIKGVIPALDAAFRMELWQHEEVKRRRKELEERLRREAEEQAREDRRREIVEKLGDGAGRREMAAIDFETAARAALAVGGATYLDHRTSARKNEIVVRFRLGGRRFECTCDKRTLQIIDAGICLTAHSDDDYFESGTKGDKFFSLESLPGVILEAEREGKLVIFRHVN